MGLQLPKSTTLLQDVTLIVEHVKEAMKICNAKVHSPSYFKHIGSLKEGRVFAGSDTIELSNESFHLFRQTHAPLSAKIEACVGPKCFKQTLLHERDNI
jgi:hypothetical protein